MNNVGIFGIGIVALLMAMASRTGNDAQGSEERVATRQLLATLHAVEDSVRGDHGIVEIRVFTIGDAGCATRSPLLCRIPLDRNRLEITDYACPRLFQQVLQTRGVTAIEAVRTNNGPNGRMSDLENIIAPLEDPPPPPIPVCH